MTLSDDLASIDRDLRALTQKVLLDDNGAPIEAHRAVKMRLRELQRGGHRPSSFSEGRGGSNNPTPAFDETDTSLNQWEKQHRDSITKAARAMKRAVDDVVIARDSVALAREAQTKILAKARIKPDGVTDEEPTDDTWCLSCLRVGAFEPRGNTRRQGLDTELCSWCFDNQQPTLDEQTLDTILEWPALALVQIHNEAKRQGTRITTKMLRDAGIDAR